MILKTLSRTSNSGQLVKYVLRYCFKEQEGENLSKQNSTAKQKNEPFIIRHNIRSKSLEGMIQELNNNEKFRITKRKNNVSLFHNIISFSNKDKDKITDKMLQDMAQKFISERGDGCIYIGTKHEENVDHIHLHIVQSSTEINGRSARISKRRFQEIKKSLETYQRLHYPELINSLPNLEPERPISKENLLLRIKATRQTNKEYLIETIESIHANAQSKEDFLTQLEAVGCKPYYRADKLQGLKYDGLKYRMGKLNMIEELFTGLGQKQKFTAFLLNLQQLRSGGVRHNQLIEKEQNQDRKLETKALDDINKIRTKSSRMDEYNQCEEKEVEAPSPYFDVLRMSKNNALIRTIE